jgi:hypothetical protein
MFSAVLFGAVVFDVKCHAEIGLGNVWIINLCGLLTFFSAFTSVLHNSLTPSSSPTAAARAAPATTRTGCRNMWCFVSKQLITTAVFCLLLVVPP